MIDTGGEEVGVRVAHLECLPLQMHARVVMVDRVLSRGHKYTTAAAVVLVEYQVVTPRL